MLISTASADNPPKFKSDRNFKIVQFTDLHYNYGSSNSDVVIEMMNNVLDVEQPDLVIFTGDVVTSKPVEKGWNVVTSPLVDRKINWAVTLGNHDDEHGRKRKEIVAILEEIPYNLTQSGDSEVHGIGNYVLPIQNQSGSKVAALLYCMDSNAYTRIKGVGTYDWFDISQVDWYRRVSTGWSKKNNDSPLPALVFFHIPLPEYSVAWDISEKQRIGGKNEEVCAPVFNSGMFAAMVHQGDVMGTFVGHDHINDFLAPFCGIALCYGRFSGGGDTYGDLMNGARVIVLKEGKWKFDTWLRLRNGEMLYKTEFSHKPPKIFANEICNETL